MILKSVIDEFLRNIEEASEETALYYLEMCNGNCKDALTLYYEINGKHNLENEEKNLEEQQIKEFDTYKSDECNYNIREPDKHFSQALIHDMDNSNFLHFNKVNKKQNKTKIDLGSTFEKLFSPPEYLICFLSFEELRKKSKDENKFILVNIQNSEFDSMLLNRDIWNNHIIQEIIKNFFIFWLRYEYDEEALIFMNTYKVEKLPYICVLCKRTGRQLKVWNIKHFHDPICAQSQLYEFIEMTEAKNNIDNNTIKNTSNNMLNDLEKNKINYNSNDNKLYNTIKEIKHLEEIKNDIDKNINSLNSLDLLKIKENTNNKDCIEEYNNINNELSELHKLRLHRSQKK